MFCEYLYFLFGKEFALGISHLNELLPFLLNLSLYLLLESLLLFLMQLLLFLLHLNRLLLSDHFGSYWRPLNILLLFGVYDPPQLRTEERCLLLVVWSHRGNFWRCTESNCMNTLLTVGASLWSRVAEWVKMLGKEKMETYWKGECAGDGNWSF